MDTDRTFDWTIVEDENGDDGGDAFETEDEPVGRPDDPRRARNVRRLLVACIVGGVAILALGVIGVRVLVHELDQRPTAREKLTSSIHDRYQARYDDCIAGSGGAETCSPKITQECANDPRWTPNDVDELADVCTFGKTG